MQEVSGDFHSPIVLRGVVKTPKPKKPKKDPADGWARMTINLDPEVAAKFEAHVKALKPRRSLSSHVADLIEKDVARATPGKEFEHEARELAPGETSTGPDASKGGSSRAPR